MGRKNRKRERGQILILCAICLMVLLLFVGLAIDFGLAYVTHAKLGKAVDSAVLTAAKNTGLGQTAFTPIAKSAFFMNYGIGSRDTAPPVVSVCNNTTCPTDSLGNTLLTVTATSTIKTYFIGLLPSFKTLSVSSSAEARFARVEMTLVIDRTGSMSTNAPGGSLQSAVISFIDDFDDVNDSVAMVSFANDVTVDVPMMTGGFQTPVTNAINNVNFQGATWSDGALQKASTVVQTSLPTVTGNVVHVVVFFTDGNANTLQDTLGCGFWNYGGYDPPTNQVGFLTPNTNPSSANCTENGAPGDTHCCSSTFPSHILGAQEPINWTNVNSDALFRAVADANAMRTATPPVIVYAVGLHGGSGVLNDLFLCQVANDPGSYCASQGYTYNPNTPQGEFALASDSTELTAAFQQIASDIRLRLLQ